MNRTIVIDKSDRRIVIGSEGLRGRPGPPGPPGGQPYTHNQPTASDTWIINHGLGRMPNVVPYSVGGVAMGARIEQIDDNQTIIKFNLPQAGFAICA